MNEHTLTLSYKTEGGTSVVKTERVQGDLSINVERGGLVAGSVNNQFVLGSIAIANIKGIVMAIKKTTGQSSESSAQVTVKTNSTSAPDDTFVGLTPEQGVAWTILDVTNVNPISVAIASLFVDVTGTADIDFVVRILVDSTPVLAG